MLKFGLLLALACAPLQLRATFDHPAYRLCRKALDARLEQDFAGPDNRVELASSMRMFGFYEAAELLRAYRHLVPDGAPILEVGPFDNPLAMSADVSGHHLVFWEYDGAAAASLRSLTPSERQVSVFQVNLRLLDESGWRSFWQSNDRQLSGIDVGPLKPGAVLLSSVINYIDYQTLLRELMPRMRDGALLILANGHVGIPDLFLHDSRLPQSLIAFEFLLSSFPERLEILDGSTVDTNVITGRSDVALALRVTNTVNPARVDQYRRAVELFFAGYSNPEIEHVQQGIRFADMMEHAAAVVKLTNSLAEVRARAVANYDRSVAQLRAQIETSVFGSPEWNAALLAVTSLPSVYNLLIERKLFVEALAIRDLNQRTSFLAQKINALYAALGHRP